MVCAVAVAVLASGGAVVPPLSGSSAKHRLSDDGGSRHCRFCHHAIAGTTDNKAADNSGVTNSSSGGHTKKGNFNARRLSGEEEFGRLKRLRSTMVRVISRTTWRRNASRSRRPKKNWQRQVVRRAAE